jgi:predicted metal-binding membrane protein
MFPLGMMNIAALATITVIVFAEKTLPWGRSVAPATAVILVGYGIAVIVAPQVLPTFGG